MKDALDSTLALFREEVTALGGEVTDRLADATRLYARAVLPESARVGPGDDVKPGIGLRVADGETEVQPYVFRVVCRNGAVLAYSGAGRVLRPAPAPDAEVREAIRSAASPEAFAAFVGDMRAARGVHVDPARFLLELARRRNLPREAVLDVLGRIHRARTKDLFALGNALTALARDTRDPEERWRREALGAAVFARLLKPRLLLPAAEAPFEPASPAREFVAG